ncbi:cell division protein FtsQ [Reichenbachiella carrageenanivorans]|uniref:Cell division protein FtsQ n=1 Tax=Reichenbachiella carrageenanivorans TaxID=2979869 RepID=A0ABY6CXY8_9BACT|nr:cell division protein FtsQ [Reichenbachiella carrageenanivorans]UXX77713.1 cell division protein FtsQ [Reichenbachiella carrageenanivorans]
MKWLIHIWKTFKIGLVLFGLAVIIGFTNSRQNERYVNDVHILIDNQFENYFINQEDVLSLIDERGKDYLLSSNFGSLNLKQLENSIEAHQFVNDAQAYIGLEGNMSIKVIQNRPIARVVVSNGSDYYIGVDGDILPESAHYTARVVLMYLANDNWIDGENIKNSEQGQEIFELIQFITHDEFWNAQISAIRVEKNQEVVLEPQVTKQEVIFGKPENIEKKFRKLMTFYKQILPYKGWNTYASVNLKFKNQIVCK